MVNENGADEDLLNLIAFLREENDRWEDSDMEELDRSGVLFLSDEHSSPH